MGALILSGAIGNVMWVFLTYGNYVEQDPFIDFIPFLPFGQWVLDTEWGGKRGYLTPGVHMIDLKVIWWVVAAVVWVGVTLLWRRIILRPWPPNRGVQRTGVTPAADAESLGHRVDAGF